MVIRYLQNFIENELGKLLTKNDLVVIALRNIRNYHYPIYWQLRSTYQVVLMETFYEVFFMKRAIIHAQLTCSIRIAS